MKFVLVFAGLFALGTVSLFRSLGVTGSGSVLGWWLTVGMVVGSLCVLAAVIAFMWPVLMPHGEAEQQEQPK